MHYCMYTHSQELPTPTIEAIRAICHKHNAELLDYTLRGGKQSRILEIFVDSVEGVTLSLCESISRDIEHELGNDPIWSDIARLNVSSPGIERPLQYHWQYPKHVGRLLTVHFSDRSICTGRLHSADKDSIVMECNGDMVTIPFANIVAAYVQLEW